jgi:hypothetical protein
MRGGHARSRRKVFERSLAYLVESGGYWYADFSPPPRSSRNESRPVMSTFGAFLDDFDDWCGTRVPGGPPRPVWLKDALAAVVLSELATRVSEQSAGELHKAISRLYKNVAEQVELNPQPIPPGRESH